MGLGLEHGIHESRLGVPSTGSEPTNLGLRTLILGPRTPYGGTYVRAYVHKCKYVLYRFNSRSIGTLKKACNVFHSGEPCDGFSQKFEDELKGSVEGSGVPARSLEAMRKANGAS